MSFFDPSSQQKLSGADGGLLTAMDSVYGFTPGTAMDDASMLSMAQRCYDVSENYFNASHRTRIMDAMARYRSQHPRGSKYWTDAFSKRSRIFRPKTRTVVRTREASAALAMFSNSSVVQIQAENASDLMAARDARMQEMLLNELLMNDRRWYQFVVGAVQDCDRQGFVIARTEWEYREATRYWDGVDHEGKPIKVADRVATRDGLHLTLVPIENMRFSPSADWTDVIGTSPYLIDMRVMYVGEIMEQMKNAKARLPYRKLTAPEIMAGSRSEVWDPIRMQREGNKLDRYARNGAPNEYTPVWVHRNIMKIDGDDYVFDTVGTSVMLSDVVPLSEVDPRGYRPYVAGYANVESHNPYPDGAVTLMSQLQDEINETANLRSDASKMATAGRMFVARSAGVDLHALARFTPGIAVELDDIANVKWDRAPAPPATAFEENNLLNTEVDGLLGVFNQQSVAANRQLNQTVGGMEMLADTGSQLTEYDLHTLAKTFYTDVLRQSLDLVKIYLTDRKMAAMIGAKAAMSERQFWTSLQTPTKVTLNVGFGATNPMKRLSRLTTGLGVLGKFFPYLMMLSNQSEIASEVFGACGYPDATRFFPFLDPSSMQDPKYSTLIQQLEQMRMLAFPHIAEAQGRAQQGQAQAQGRIQAAQITAQANLQKQAAVNASNEKIREMELQMARIELQLEQEKTDISRQQLLLAREKLSNEIVMQQEQLILQAQGTPLANPHAMETPLAPAEQAIAQRLQTPPSADVPIQTVPQMVQTADEMGRRNATGADLRQAMTGK